MVWAKAIDAASASNNQRRDPASEPFIPGHCSPVSINKIFNVWDTVGAEVLAGLFTIAAPGIGIHHHPGLLAIADFH